MEWLWILLPLGFLVLFVVGLALSTREDDGLWQGTPTWWDERQRKNRYPDNE